MATTSGFLDVTRPHKLYFEESGSPFGKPVLFLHGGPGGATSPKHRRFFDPKRYRIVLLDQRGCGRSTPHGSVERNTTADLVQDVEELREHLKIHSWQLFGGSWGSTLAIAYAEAYPNRVTELVLRGIFLLREREIQWFYQDGASRIYPEEWNEFISVIPSSRRDDVVGAYHELLIDGTREEQVRAAHAWTAWEKKTSSLRRRKQDVERALTDNDYALAFARIECHYFMNGGFFRPEDQLLRDIERIRHIPCVIIQGRYDLVCPMETAWALHNAWPEADFRVVEAAGHSAFEPGIVHELVSATDRFAADVSD